jgi:imidazolonepropionase-like amidohydrolase
MTIRALLVGATVLVIAGCGAGPESGPRTLYSGFTLVDPATETITPEAWLIVRGGRIADIGKGKPPSGTFDSVLDMSGTFAMPGLIDAHAHITAGPQRVTVADGKPQVEITTGDEFSRSNAAIALASGVTSVRNPGGSTSAAARYDAMLAAGEWVGPEARHAGAVNQPPPFVGESFAYPTTPDAWNAEAARQAAAGMTYFKLYVGLTEDELAQGVKAAKAHGLVPIAHLNGVSWTRAIELGVEQLEHALPTSPDLLEPEQRAQFTFGADYMTRWFELADYDGPLMQQLLKSLVRRRIAVDLTLQVNELIYHADDLDTVFPELAGELPDYLHPAHVKAIKGGYAALAAVPAERLARGRAIWPKVLQLARVMHEAGVALMIGTDGPGGGPTFAHELNNHVRAGISIWEVLRMATSGNAALMGLTQTGRLAAGLEADIVFLRGNPTTDVQHTREVQLVVTNGVPHTPDSVLDVARQIAAAARARAVD